MVFADLNKLLAVHLHVLDIDILPQSRIPIFEAALHNHDHIPETLEQPDLSATHLQLLEVWHVHLEQRCRLLKLLHLLFHA